MNLLMNKKEMIAILLDSLGAGFKTKVEKLDDGYKVSSSVGETWVPIVPTIEKVEEEEPFAPFGDKYTPPEKSKNYSIVWSNRKGKPRAITFTANGISQTWEEEHDGEFTYEVLLSYEMGFCIEYRLDFSDLTKGLSWAPLPSHVLPYFNRTRTSEVPTPHNPRMCERGCGHVMRYWEALCPFCEQQEIYHNP